MTQYEFWTRNMFTRPFERLTIKVSVGKFWLDVISDVQKEDDYATAICKACDWLLRVEVSSGCDEDTRIVKCTGQYMYMYHFVRMLGYVGDIVNFDLMEESI